MSHEQQEGVSAGKLEYVRGKWWQLLDDMEPLTVPNVQRRVDLWLTTCMGEDVGNNKDERYLRVAEEFAELMSACQAPLPTIIEVLTHVYEKEHFSFKLGSISEESADLMVCLAALATTHKIDLGAETNRIIDRNWDNIDKIREKHRAKRHKSTATIKEKK